MLPTSGTPPIQQSLNGNSRRTRKPKRSSLIPKEHISGGYALASHPAATVHENFESPEASHINQEDSCHKQNNAAENIGGGTLVSPKSVSSSADIETPVIEKVGSRSNLQSNEKNVNKRGRRRGRPRNRPDTTLTETNKQGVKSINVVSNTLNDNIQKPSTKNASETSTGQSGGSRSMRQKPFVTRERNLKPQAQDVATRIYEEIKNCRYECLICTNHVQSKSKIWACKTCWSVLHLACVSRWASNEISTFKQNPSLGQETTHRKWRCPGCNTPKEDFPTTYLCWCSKECEPLTVAGLPPHSCGQTCARARGNHCPHPCESTCHAGPCHPCNHMGPPISCFCGKRSISKKCLNTDYENKWSCKQICGKILPCGKHNCRKTCHEGSCGSCELPVKSNCYCTKMHRELSCSQLNNLNQSKPEGESRSGSFNCGNKCYQLFDCGNPKHFCDKVCHNHGDQLTHCPFSPDVIDHCPCGKTPLTLLLKNPRKDCAAEIPNCEEKCYKTLPCGHYCEMKCHVGECGPCQLSSKISCRCGRTISDIPCHLGRQDPPQCSRVCRSILNCGRHECSNRCCTGEKKAGGRLASKRKNRGMITTLGTINHYEAEHICMKICGRPLKCGLHNCSSLCHKGPCPGCLEGVFEDISCACGRTVLQAPQPCGTTSPECTFDCIHQPACGHPAAKHLCHPESDPCPKCTFLTKKKCICGKKTLNNLPCWFNEVQCGLICGKMMKCGVHACQKPCHRDGQCEDSNSACIQPCGRKRVICGHPCRQKCHVPYPCKETEPCQARTFITCACQNQKQQVKCLASTGAPGNSKKELACNDNCLKIQRNARLADALKINPDTHQDDHIPYSTKTLTLFSNDKKFGLQYEREFREFASDENEKKKRFKPMSANQRAFIHSLAEDFGLVSESLDAEPHRHVSIFKTPRFVSAPLKTLNQCMQIASTKNLPTSVKFPLTVNSQPWNAILLVTPRFGLTLDEIQVTLRKEFESSGLVFDISFLPSENFMLRAITPELNSEKIALILESKRITLARIFSSLGMANSTILCSVDDGLNILKREDSCFKYDGWNQVVRGANIVKKVVPNFEKTNIFSTLIKPKKESVSRLKKEETPDDWEREVENWD